MRFDLDHLVVCASPGAPEAEHLVRFGLTEGAPNQHPGQGTACRRFFFRNAYLELLWVVDQAELQSELVRRTGLWERLTRERGASPFGMALRPSGQADTPAPFATWEYRPPYLPAPYAIPIATDSEDWTAPLIFVMPLGLRPRADEAGRRPLPVHAAGLEAMTRVQFRTPRALRASHSLEVLEQECPWFKFAPADAHVVEVEFDDQAAGRSEDFRPTLPIVLRW